MNPNSKEKLLNQKPSGVLAKMGNIVQIMIFIALSGILIFNPVSSIKTLITLVGGVILLVGVFHLLRNLKEKVLPKLLLASLEILFGLFLIFNIFLSLSMLSFSIGILLIIGALIAFAFMRLTDNIRKNKEATIIDHDNPTSLISIPTRVKTFLKKISPLALGLTGGFFILFPTWGSVLVSYSLAAMFLSLAFYKTSKLFQTSPKKMNLH